MAGDLDTGQIREWRSIVTLIVFVLANLAVLFPFHVPIYIPRIAVHAFRDALISSRIISRHSAQSAGTNAIKRSAFVRFRFPINMITAPLIADLFLLAILAIGRREVHDGTVGADNIFPLDIMAFFLTLAYIAIAIDASGLIRWLAFKVLQRGGKAGHLLYFYLYLFFLALATLAGNDPIVLSGTPFLAYLTAVSRNIKDSKAWIFMQFSIANVGSAILVSSNPTNLVLAGAFGIKFVQYTANIIVPVVVTAVVLFPFLLWVLFRDDELIPKSIQLHDLPDHLKNEEPQNPNIQVRSTTNADTDEDDEEERAKFQMLKEILNPYVDKKAATIGAVIMIATLITILALNAASPAGNENPVYWITLPAAFVMFCWGLTYEWFHRHENRRLSRTDPADSNPLSCIEVQSEKHTPPQTDMPQNEKVGPRRTAVSEDRSSSPERMKIDDSDSTQAPETDSPTDLPADVPVQAVPANDVEKLAPIKAQPTTLQSLCEDAYLWLRETFPTVTTVVVHLPFPLVAFALCVFVLVQSLVSRGWVAVFAHGWDEWVHHTGTVGAIGGMGFLSVVLCNFAGTNIGTTILLCRVVQLWVEIHNNSGVPISERTFWATVYSMAIGLNYGAFSTAFSASLAGLLWRDILARKNIHVSALAFARINIPIIAVTTIVGLSVLVGEMYITRDTSPYKPG